MTARETADNHATALACAAARGDSAALDEFIRATQRDVWRFVAHLADVTSADDLAQETFVRAISALPSFAGRASARTWLLAIARRVCVDQVRRSMSRPRISAGTDWTAAADSATSASPSSGYEGAVELNMLLDGLMPERREAIVLTQVLGLSYAEAAEVLHVPVGTVRSRVARGRDELISARRADESVG